MWESIRKMWKIPELRNKILYTLGMLLLFRLVGVIPAPGVDAARVLTGTATDLPILQLVNMMTGSNFANMTIMAMGITPYINASIIMQLLTIAIPALERMQRDEEGGGREKIARITRYVTVGLAAVQAIGLVAGLGYIKSGWFNYVLVGISMAGGSALAMWIGERITQNGVGNGISLLIFVGIIASFPGQVYTGIQSVILNPMSAWAIPVVIVGIIVLVVGIVFVDSGQRRIPVQYAKRMVGRKMYGGQSTHIPMKVNSTGVMPLIFAISIIQFPGLIAQFWPTSGFALWYGRWFNASSWVYMVVYALLILFFTYFYTSISFNPTEMSKNLQQNGGFIPGIRPGKPTSDYLDGILEYIILIGACGLIIVCLVPIIVSGLFSVSRLSFGGTSLIIIVGVVLETIKAVESQMLVRNYKGFLND